jgi:hypothetical protein|tara:strand:- start:99 stop:281 length:183 start_codon:yes stop_codon:yes gene_type:complete
MKILESLITLHYDEKGANDENVHKTCWISISDDIFHIEKDGIEHQIETKKVLEFIEQNSH